MKLANENVKIKRGSKAGLPAQNVPGTIYITTDTGEMFVDDTVDSRIQISPEAITNEEIDAICSQTIEFAEDVVL